MASALNAKSLPLMISNTDSSCLQKLADYALHLTTSFDIFFRDIIATRRRRT
jgi:hypothetical protein